MCVAGLLHRLLKFGMNSRAEGGCGFVQENQAAAAPPLSMPIAEKVAGWVWRAMPGIQRRSTRSRGRWQLLACCTTKTFSRHESTSHADGLLRQVGRVGILPTAATLRRWLAAARALRAVGHAQALAVRLSTR